MGRMTDQEALARLPLTRSERPVAVVGAAAGFAALFSAAACCVLPVLFALAGFGAGGLAFVVPYHWPLTIAAAVAIAIGWALYARKRRSCARDSSCAAPARSTLVLLGLATAFLLLSAVWKALLEAPLRDWLLTL